MDGTTFNQQIPNLTQEQVHGLLKLLHYRHDKITAESEHSTKESDQSDANTVHPNINDGSTRIRSKKINCTGQKARKVNTPSPQPIPSLPKIDFLDSEDDAPTPERLPNCVTAIFSKSLFCLVLREATVYERTAILVSGLLLLEAECVGTHFQYLYDTAKWLHS
ncbi:hypothetical protein FQA39_LY09579 [Lamprigera yunnana]|nr:hypothetical protein FQA39_LY09579 [Lamprigera yunnana]